MKIRQSVLLLVKIIGICIIISSVPMFFYLGYRDNSELKRMREFARDSVPNQFDSIAVISDNSEAFKTGKYLLTQFDKLNKIATIVKNNNTECRYPLSGYYVRVICFYKSKKYTLKVYPQKNEKKMFYVSYYFDNINEDEYYGKRLYNMELFELLDLNDKIIAEIYR